MNLNSQKIVDRWSLNNIPRRSKPRGERECLDRALKELGPFTQEHDEKLQGDCTCATCAEKAVTFAATGFNAYEAVIDGAPRKKEIVEELLGVERALRDAAAKLVGLSNHARKTLRNWDESDFDEFVPERYQDVVHEQTPEPDRPGKKGKNGSFVERLVALADHAQFCVRTIERRSQGKPGSKGGRTNLMREQLGPTAARLVVQCWGIFHKGRQVEGKASENGSFMRFLNAVREYATGDAEENATVVTWAKKLAKPLREFDKQVARREAFLEEIGPLLAGPKSEFKAKFADLVEANDEISAAISGAYAEIVRTINGPRRRTAS